MQGKMIDNWSGRWQWPKIDQEIYKILFNHQRTTVDGRNPANQLRLVVYPMIYRVLYIPVG